MYSSNPDTTGYVSPGGGGCTSSGVTCASWGSLHGCRCTSLISASTVGSSKHSPAERLGTSLLTRAREKKMPTPMAVATAKMMIRGIRLRLVGPEYEGSGWNGGASVAYGDPYEIGAGAPDGGVEGGGSLGSESGAPPAFQPGFPLIASQPRMPCDRWGDGLGPNHKRRSSRKRVATPERRLLPRRNEVSSRVPERA